MKRRTPVVQAWQDLLEALTRYLRDGIDLARCRLTGGHQFGTWRAMDATGGRVVYPHTWCRRCGWCQQVQSFDEERIGATEGWYP